MERGKSKTTLAFTSEIGFLLLDKQSQVYFLETAGRKNAPWWSGRCGVCLPIFSWDSKYGHNPTNFHVTRSCEYCPVACKLPITPSCNQQKGLGQ